VIREPCERNTTKYGHEKQEVESRVRNCTSSTEEELRCCARIRNRGGDKRLVLYGVMDNEVKQESSKRVWPN